MIKPAAAPAAANTTTKPAMSTTVRRLFAVICSYIEVERAQSSELHVGRLARPFFRLEVLPLGVLHRAGQHDGRERLDLRVIRQYRVVVELPRVGDPPFGGAQLFLQREEVLIGLQVGVGL